MNMHEILRMGPVMPVIVIEDAEHAVPLARALLAGGVRVLEVTLRSAAALEAIRVIAREVPQALVGAGTILNAHDLQQAQRAGACFGVSPGASSELLRAARAGGWPFLPGVATPSEAMAAMEMGFEALKFFPAAAAGGAAMLRALAGPLPQLRFCPTGGITLANAAEYLALPNVVCVGGSWLTPRELVQAGRWSEVAELARQAMVLKNEPMIE
jgi:2-dehydro-3-deoxyphosphogluconate aldolase/(4S)-4-hydroxy-2-oxoglutarate aldolase